MNDMIEFSVVVFPEAVSPTTKTVCSFSRASQRYAESSGLSVPHLVIWKIERGSPSLCRMVSEGPLTETSPE
jgi:hypothetical protein